MIAILFMFICLLAKVLMSYNGTHIIYCMVLMPMVIYRVTLFVEFN